MIKVLLLVLSLFFKHVLAAPKKLKPEERLLLHLQTKSKEHQSKAAKKLGSKLTQLYKKNKLAAEDVSQLLQAADDAGVEFSNPIPKKRKNMSDWTMEPENGSEPAEGPRDKNAARTLDRFLRKNHNWTDLYWAKVPMKSPAKKSTDVQDKWMPFLLPHDWLPNYLLQARAWQEGMPEEGTFLAREMAQACRAWGNPEGSMFPVGLHGDGVPVQGRMNQSTLDFWTVNLPGSPKFQALRIPICCLDTRMISWQTIDSICQILLWSFQCLGEGKFPTARHDGSPWLKSDKNRQLWAGKHMPGKAGIVQIRSVWDWTCKYFHAGQWNELAGMCWLCSAKPSTWRDIARCPVAERQEKSLNKAAYLAFLADRGKEVNPLFTLPNVSNKTLLPDWMHVCDEGTGAVAAGQILKELLPVYEGNTIEEKCFSLWQHIQELYTSQAWPHDRRLRKLTVKDIFKPKKVPELDGKAHEVRHFCPLLESLCKAKGFQEGTLHQRAVYKVAKHCSAMYSSLEKADLAQLVKSGRKFISQYMALEEEATHIEPDTRLWRCKPKFHYVAHILDLV